MEISRNFAFFCWKKPNFTALDPISGRVPSIIYISFMDAIGKFYAWKRDWTFNNYNKIMVGIRGLLRERQFIRALIKIICPKGKPRANDHFTCEAKPSKGKMHCPRAQRVKARHLLARINCRALDKPPYNFLNIIRRAINRFLLDAKNLFIYAACYKKVFYIYLHPCLKDEKKKFWNPVTK